MKNQELIDEIYRAFKNVKLEEGIGLWESMGLDDYADEETIRELRRNDEKEDWDKIPFEDLNNCYSSLSFFDAKGMRFHLPKFMLYEVMEDELAGLLPPSSADLIFHFERGITGEKYSKEQFSLLNKEQIDCIVHFIAFYLEKVIEQDKEYHKLHDMDLSSYYDTEYIRLKELLTNWKKKLY